MKKGLVVLLVGIVVIGSGGCSYLEGGPSLEECYEKDRRESEQLARAIGPLLASDVRSTLGEASACDSVPEGGASITYDVAPNVPPEVVLEKFHSAGWSDLPQSVNPCLQDHSCIAGVSKNVDGRRIEVTVEESAGGYMLEALFDD